MTIDEHDNEFLTLVLYLVVFNGNQKQIENLINSILANVLTCICSKNCFCCFWFGFGKTIHAFINIEIN